jgi:hypothetical protein
VNYWSERELLLLRPQHIFARFRTGKTGRGLSTTYEEFFGTSISSSHPPTFHITETVVKVVTRPYNDRVDEDCERPQKVEPGIFLSLTPAMSRGALYCLEMAMPSCWFRRKRKNICYPFSLADLCNITGRAITYSSVL